MLFKTEKEEQQYTKALLAYDITTLKRLKFKLPREYRHYNQTLYKYTQLTTDQLNKLNGSTSIRIKTNNSVWTKQPIMFNMNNSGIGLVNVILQKKMSPQDVIIDADLYSKYYNGEASLRLYNKIVLCSDNITINMNEVVFT